MIRIDMPGLLAALADMGIGTEQPRLVAANLSFTRSMRRCLQQMDVQSAAALRANAPLSLAILDADRFKRINDTLGHERGDAVLVGFVNRVQAGLRDTDVLGRWGGEEFMLLMPDTSPEHALRITERLREAVASSPAAAGVPMVTFSGGPSPSRGSQASSADT